MQLKFGMIAEHRSSEMYKNSKVVAIFMGETNFTTLTKEIVRTRWLLSVPPRALNMVRILIHITFEFSLAPTSRFLPPAMHLHSESRDIDSELTTTGQKEAKDKPQIEGTGMTRLVFILVTVSLRSQACMFIYM